MVYSEIREIPRRYPDVDLALLHLGGTKILGLVTVTMDAIDGVKMMQTIVPKRPFLSISMTMMYSSLL
jgi:hypothetical protein